MAHDSIKAILFDLGDIFFEAHYWRKYVWKRLRAANVFHGSFTDYYLLYDKFLIPAYRGDIAYNDCLMSFLLRVGVKDAQNLFAEIMAKKIEFENSRKLFRCVKKTLEQLKRIGIQNYVLTDNELSGDEVRHRILERYHINHLLEKVVSSCDIGYLKSDPRAFLKTLSIIGSAKSTALFVGHDRDEISSAKKAGMTVVEFNNYLRVNTSADIKISKFFDLLNIPLIR